MKVVVTGATGLIGRQLIHQLMIEGHNVLALARSPEKLPELPPENVYRWSDEQVPNSAIFKNCDAVIHLAGEGIADKLWTNSRKQKLRNSRVLGTKNIAQSLLLLPAEQRPKTFISGSAIGYYANTSESQDESSAPGSGFLADLCKDWEAAALECKTQGLRTVLLRTGLVLARDGGFLKKSGPVVLGDGTQWMSWIHIDDVVQMIKFALMNESIEGPINLTSPNPVSNKVFTKSYAKTKHIPLNLSAPSVILKTLTGDLSQAILANQKVMPSKALAAGFKFKFTDLESALKDLIGNTTFTENFLSTKQFIPLERHQVFSFFSKAENLEILTPPWLSFKILNTSTPTVEKGTLINYTLKIHGVPVRWRTLIKEWNPDSSFVDFQLKGPYKKWHHLHTFEDVPGGTLISDNVTYVIPGGIFGKALLPLIQHDVETIFKYRQKKINELHAENRLR